MEFDKVVEYSMGFIVVGVIVVAAFLALDGLAPSVSCSFGTWNETSRSCWNGTHNVNSLLTSAGNSTAKINQGIYNSVEMAPTWGTLIGVSILIAIVLGGLVVGYGFGKDKGYW